MKAIFSRLTLATLLPVLASCTNYYKSPSNGQCMELADPSDWSIREGENA